jgi:septum formation protein
VLASGSPARLRLLHDVGITPTVVVSGVDEDSFSDDDPSALVEALAVAKASAVTRDLPSSYAQDALVIGCDSMLDVDGRAVGKPVTAARAAARWRLIRGRSAVLRTGHCLIDTATDQRVAAVASTTVHFADVSDAEIDAYVGTGEPVDVAGAFTVDGYGGAFVRAIEGDHHNVVGLSLPLVRDLLPRIGLHWLDIWAVGPTRPVRRAPAGFTGPAALTPPADQGPAR